MRAVEIFAGVGGLALGVSRAGFTHDIILERDEHACSTIKANRDQGVKHVADWFVHEGDIESFDFTTLREGLDLLCGGPPCQPFSLAGKSLGNRDARDLFPQAVRAVRELRPRAFVFENVKGLLRHSHSEYLEYVRLQLNSPHVVKQPSETWKEHRSRLERSHTKGAGTDEEYRVIIHAANAADYGVPQRRTRVFIVGIRADLGLEWSFPPPTHSREELLVSKFVSGEYWEHHKISRKRRQYLSAASMVNLQKHRQKNPIKFARWLTVRDSLSDLPNPSRFKKINVANHSYIPGARKYEGHTGSELDEPAKTLKAGVHGVPGGENMLIHCNGRVRYFTVREKARLQTFPDEFEFFGNWTTTTRQLGNAVPVHLGFVVAQSLYKVLS